MADLDDFFAKKDRKKSKGKKFTTTEEIAKRLEETGKKVEKTKKEKTAQPQGQEGEDLTKNTQEDEEWKEFEEEKKDYTGLKIQNLTMHASEDGDSTEREDCGDLEENDQGEMVPKRKGPWKLIEADSASTPGGVAPVVATAATAAAVVAPPVAPQDGKTVYVSPMLRNQMQQAPRERSIRCKPGAPDITNQDFFPTLTAASNETAVSWGRRKQEAAFEEVKNSRSHSNRGDVRSTQGLQIGNKFRALESEQS